jgi:hypothetical protein
VVIAASDFEYLRCVERSSRIEKLTGPSGRPNTKNAATVRREGNPST